MTLTTEEKMALLNKAIAQVQDEYDMRPISPEYATATFMVFAAVLQRWFNLSDEDLDAFLRASKKLDMTTRSAKNMVN